jgi:hypothetical protein
MHGSSRTPAQGTGPDTSSGRDDGPVCPSDHRHPPLVGFPGSTSEAGGRPGQGPTSHGRRCTPRVAVERAGRSDPTDHGGTPRTPATQRVVRQDRGRADASHHSGRRPRRAARPRHRGRAPRVGEPGHVPHRGASPARSPGGVPGSPRHERRLTTGHRRCGAQQHAAPFQFHRMVRGRARCCPVAPEDERGRWSLQRTSPGGHSRRGEQLTTVSSDQETDSADRRQPCPRRCGERPATPGRRC